MGKIISCNSGTTRAIPTCRGTRAFAAGTQIPPIPDRDVRWKEHGKLLYLAGRRRLMLHCQPVLTRLKPTTTSACTQRPQNRDLPIIAVDRHFSHQPSFGQKIHHRQSSNTTPFPIHIGYLGGFQTYRSSVPIEHYIQHRSQSVFTIPVPITTRGSREHALL